MALAADTPLALTMGDPAGIGGEIALASWARRDEYKLTPFFVLDNPARLSLLAEALRLNVPIVEITDPAEAHSVWATGMPVLSIGPVPPTTFGKPDPKAAGSVIRSIDTAVELARTGRAAAVVTNPLQKSILYAEGFTFQGHTDYIASLCARGGTVPRAVMMLASDDLRVVPVTIHEPLARVPQSLTIDLIVETAEITARALRDQFGIAHPRLAVAGLNPHAGEAGTIGSEDATVIDPAVAALKTSGIEAQGPLSADTMFHAAARARYDAAICMYHDQALIPIKTLAFETAVNVTLGLPIIRTSPDHGTALDIAGTGRASHVGFVAALKLARDLADKRT